VSGDPIPVEPTSGESREPRAAKAKPIVCEFCACTLTATGEVLRMSADAKRFRDAVDDLEDANADVERLNKVVEGLRAELDTAKAAAVTVTRPRGNEF